MKPLTPRELAVQELVLKGLTNKEIGERLAISYRTVELHRARIFAKHGVRNAVELARLILGGQQCTG